MMSSRTSGNLQGTGRRDADTRLLLEWCLGQVYPGEPPRNSHAAKGEELELELALEHAKLAIGARERDHRIMARTRACTASAPSTTDKTFTIYVISKAP